MIPAGVPPPVEVQADRLVFEDGRITATGGVTLTRAGQTVVAESGTFDLDSQTLTLAGGALQQGELVLSFQAAWVTLDAEEALLQGVVADGLGWHLAGASLLLLPDGTLVVEDAVATACEATCAHRPPWALEARRAEVDPGRTLRVDGGWIRFWGLRVVPVPRWFTSLDPHEPHLEAPVLGWVDGHPALGLPVRWGHPRGLQMRGNVGYWRTLQSDLSARWGVDSEATTALTWEDGELRGEATVHHVQVSTGLRVGVDGQWVSDPTWLSQRSRTLAGRTATWSDLRAIAGFGPARVEVTTVQTAAPTTAVTPAAVLTAPAGDLGPVLGEGTARFDLVDGQLRSEASGALWQAHSGALLEVEGGLAVRALAYEGEDGGLDAAARAEVRLPLWRDTAWGRQEWVVGVRGAAGWHQGPDPARPWEEWDEGLWIGPQVQTGTWGPGGTRAWGRIWVPWDRESWGIDAVGRLARGPLSVGAQARWRDDDGLLAGRVGWTGTRGGLWAEAAAVGRETLDPYGRAGAWTALSTRHATWDLGATVLADGDGLGETLGTVAWRSGCDCLLVGGSVGWARDQQGPAVGLRVDLTP